MGQEQAVWNRHIGEWDSRVCAWCDELPADLIHQHYAEWYLPEPLILSGGYWLHPDCAEHIARVAIRERTPEREPEPDSRTTMVSTRSTWLHGTALIGCIVGLLLLPFGFVWNLPLLAVVLGLGFIGGLAWIDGLD